MVGESSQARGTGGAVVGGQGGGVKGGGVGINCNSRNSRASGIVDYWGEGGRHVELVVNFPRWK